MALRNGFGKETYPNEDFYEGEFWRGARNGEGTYYRKDGSHYEGSICDCCFWLALRCIYFVLDPRVAPLSGNHVLTRSGLQVVTFALDVVRLVFGVHLMLAQGQFAEGMMSGRGSFFYARNEVYEGEWHDSKRHGSGKFTYYDGTLYDGKWERDLRHGHGFMRYSDGSCFDGLWAEDVRHGRGQMDLADGGQFVGDWADDKRHGTGCQTFPNGSTYEGAFVCDIPNGVGIMFDKDERSRYEGQFVDGLRSGTGKCEYLESKDKFVGVWSAGARVHGLVFFADGTVERVGYLNNRLVRRELIDPDEQARLKREEKASECEVTAAADGTASLARGSQVESRMGSGPPEAVTVSLVR